MKAILKSAKVKGVAIILAGLGLTAAAKDVSADNVDRYAVFALRQTEQRHPDLFAKVEHNFRCLGL